MASHGVNVTFTFADSTKMYVGKTECIPVGSPVEWPPLSAQPCPGRREKMPSTTISDEAIEAAVAVLITYTAGATKRGRDKRWPYVPVVLFNHKTGNAQTQQIMNRAFETRYAALDFAERHLANLKQSLRDKLRTPRYRALRESVGLPAEIT